jgi:hypothetical protein
VVYGYSPSEDAPEETRALEEQLTQSRWYELPPEVRPSILLLTYIRLGECVPLGRLGINVSRFFKLAQLG